MKLKKLTTLFISLLLMVVVLLKIDSCVDEKFDRHAWRPPTCNGFKKPFISGKKDAVFSVDGARVVNPQIQVGEDFEVSFSSWKPSSLSGVDKNGVKHKCRPPVLKAYVALKGESLARYVFVGQANLNMRGSGIISARLKADSEFTSLTSYDHTSGGKAGEVTDFFEKFKVNKMKGALIAVLITEYPSARNPGNVTRLDYSSDAEYSKTFANFELVKLWIT